VDVNDLHLKLSDAMGCMDHRKTRDMITGNLSDNNNDSDAMN